jgi:hypothetical protein
MFVPDQSFNAVLGLAASAGLEQDTFCRATGAVQ